MTRCRCRHGPSPGPSTAMRHCGGPGSRPMPVPARAATGAWRCPRPTPCSARREKSPLIALSSAPRRVPTARRKMPDPTSQLEPHPHDRHRDTPAGSRPIAAPLRRPARAARPAAARQRAAGRALALPPAARGVEPRVRARSTGFASGAAPILVVGDHEAVAAIAARPARGLSAHRAAGGDLASRWACSPACSVPMARPGAPAAHGDGRLRPGARAALLPLDAEAWPLRLAGAGRRPRAQGRRSTCRPT
jgi:hypothetical protein